MKKHIYLYISYNGKFYIRSGINTIELNGGNLTNFLLNKSGKTWDDIVEEKFTLEEIDLNTIEKFKNLSRDRVPNIQNENNLEQLLRKLNLYEGNYLKEQLFYFFAKIHNNTIYNAILKIGRLF